jgi:glucosamine--fructose-6-phosphate aminotransferase (isomerizing)
VAVTNDPDSPLGDLADVVLPICAGDEATVATKTFMNTFAVLDALAGALSARMDILPRVLGPGVPEMIDEVARQAAIASSAVDAMDRCGSISLVARGAAVAAADYGALVIKETAALPAEAMPAGSFRHGPLEICGPAVGLVVLAQGGPTQALCVQLAREASDLGSPTWLIGDEAATLAAETERLRVTAIPAIADGYVALSMSVPIQRLAAGLARRRGRVPGELVRSRKVTDIE